MQSQKPLQSSLQLSVVRGIAHKQQNVGHGSGPVLCQRRRHIVIVDEGAHGAVMQLYGIDRIPAGTGHGLPADSRCRRA
eukprot:8080505-Karenia_brevis.AAC.1